MAAPDEAPPGPGFVSLYRRYRPGRFEELRGQPHVVKALRSAVRGGSVAHAYLFSGPRGTGKTSAARILARALDCADPRDGEPCGTCTSCTEIAAGQSLDVHELDAASNNGVDAMRDLVAHAALGTPGRWKVYIVDEVHMLSNAAANALLKTLEEPPSHVVFVLATTDPQKVPPTIRSRTQHFEFRLLGPDDLERLVREVRDDAGLELDDQALQAAVRRGKGSARDTLSALDQLAALGGADESRPSVAEVTTALEDDASAVLVSVARLLAAGWSPQQLAADVVDELRQAFLLSLSPETAEVAGTDRERLTEVGRQCGLPKIVRAMELLGQAIVDMREAPDSRVVLEVALARVVLPELDPSAEGLVERVAGLERAVARGSAQSGAEGGGPSSPAPTSSSASSAASASPAAPAAPAPTEPAKSSPTPAPGAPAPAPEGRGTGVRPDGGAQASGDSSDSGDSGDSGGTVPADLPDRDTLVEAWGDHVLRGLPPRAKAFCSAGRFVSVEGGRAQFALPNAAHRDRCEAVRPMLEAGLAEHFGRPVPIEFVVEGQSGRPPQGPPAPGSPDAPGTAPARKGQANASPRRSGSPAVAGSPDPDEHLSGSRPPEGRRPEERPSGARPTRDSGRRVPESAGPDGGDSEDSDDSGDFEPLDLDHEVVSEASVESMARAKLLDAFPGAQEVSE